VSVVSDVGVIARDAMASGLRAGEYARNLWRAPGHHFPL